MLYSCTHVATMGVKGIYVVSQECADEFQLI